MAITRPFGYNPSQNPIPGTDSFGTLVVGSHNLDFSQNPGGIKWWMGPDETDGYIISGVVSGGTHPSPVGNIGTVQFWRTGNLTSRQFINLANKISLQNFIIVGEAIEWLNNNGYFTTYDPLPASLSPGGYRYYKWEIFDTKRIGDGVQASEFVFLNSNGPDSMVGVTVSNPGGFYSGNINGPEGVTKLVDGSSSTKWFDQLPIGDTSVVIFDFGIQKEFVGYRWATANDIVIPGNDYTVRDPKTWAVYGSNDGVSYTELSFVNNFVSTNVRGVFNYDIYFNYVTPTPSPVASLTPTPQVTSTPTPTPTPNPGYRYYKWEISGTRTLSDGVQASEFVFINNGVVDPMVGVTISNPNGFYSGNIYGPEGVTKLVDGNLTTKWFDQLPAGDTSEVIFDFGTQKEFTAYKWATANDNINRDPKNWKIYGSNDNITYTQVNSVNNYVSTSSRGTFNDIIEFNPAPTPTPTNKYVPTPILDVYSGASAAYSLRKLRSAYTGAAIRVRRSSDNAEQDIGFFNGELDTATLTSFVGSNNGFVTTWYDQTGNGFPATQSTAGSQPIIVTSGSVVTQSYVPAIQLLSGSTNGFVTSLSVNNPFSFMSVMSQTIEEPMGYTRIIQSTTNNNLLTIRRGDGLSIYVGASTILTNFPSQISDKPYLISFLKDSTSNFVYQNGNSVSVGSSASSNWGTLSIGAPGVYNEGATSKISELIVYPNNQNSNISGLRSNINSYYLLY